MHKKSRTVNFCEYCSQMADASSSPKERGCSKCNPNSEDNNKSNITGASPREINKCSNCKYKPVAGGGSSTYQTNRKEITRALPNPLIEKMRGTLQRFTAMPTTWLKKRREARLRERTEYQKEKQRQIKRKLYQELEVATRQSGIMPVVPKLQIYQQENKPTQCRLILLGSRASGKSTIINQMRILHGNGFTNEEKKQMIKNIKESIIDAVLAITRVMEILTPTQTYQHPENHAKVEYLRERTRRYGYDYPPEVFENIKAMWKDEGVQATYHRRNEYQLADNVKYFLDKIDIIKLADYIPTEQDILYCYVRYGTHEHVESRFQINECMFEVYRPGAVRPSGPKFCHYFYSAQSFVYMISSDSYETMISDECYTVKENRLKNSLASFKSLCRNLWSSNKSVILLLNKQDLLRKKILEGKSKLEEHFPRFSNYQTPLDVPYQASEHSEVTRAKYFIRDEFLSTFATSGNAFQFCYPHFTCAVDTENIKQLLSDCCNTIQYLNICGFDIL